MKLSSLNRLAECASMIFGSAMPLQINGFRSGWDGRRADDKTQEMREALEALSCLEYLHDQPKTKTLAEVLYYAFVQHGEKARPAVLPTMALVLTPPPKPPKASKLKKWAEKSFDMFERAMVLWARTSIEHGRVTIRPIREAA